MRLNQPTDPSLTPDSPKDMEVDVEQSPPSSPMKKNGMVVEVAGPCVIQYKDKKNREKDKKVKNDCYCWICHHTGKMLCCERCPRVFHIKCVPLNDEPDDDWVCPCCEHVEECKKLGDRSKCCRTNLAKMLPYALDRMSSSGTEAFQQPVTTDVAPNYFDFVNYPMDMGTLRQKAKAGVWTCTQNFLDEARWILHNCIIFNGGKSRLTALARTVYNVCQHEMLEINLCPDCFLNSCTADKDWFTRPCNKQHRLVWAKLRGFPFWPAKVLQRQGQQIDVRFFGQHERAWVHESNTLDISEEPPAGNRNKESGTSRTSAEEEMNRYVENLKKANKWPIDVSKLKEERDDDDDDAKTPPQENSVARKKKKDRGPPSSKDALPKAPKLKISSNSLLKDERVSNAFKFEDAELKGTHKTERTPHPSGKRRKTDEKIKIDIETDRMKLNKQKLAYKKSTSYSSLVNASPAILSIDSTVEKVFSATSNGCSSWKYSSKLMEAISGMVEEMFEETKLKYKAEAEKAVELAKIAAELEKETFKLEFKKDSKCRNCKSKSSGTSDQESTSSSSRLQHEEELRVALEEQRTQLEAEKDRQIEELRQLLTAEKEKAIVETKKSQWCANCSGPAMYHCCWNTSYCGYTCQRGHWPQHMYKCEQQNRAAQAGQMDGMVLARQAPNQLPASPSEQVAHEHVNSRPD